MSRKKKPQPSPEYRPFNPNAAEERREREHKMLASVGFKKVKISDELEAEATRLLAEQDHDLLLRLVENTEAIRQGMESIKLPSNNPHYLQTLEDCKRQRDLIANKIDKVHLTVDHGHSWIGLSLVNSRHHADALEAVRKLGEHFDAEIIRHDEASK